jgi:plastocyanin
MRTSGSLFASLLLGLLAGCSSTTAPSNQAASAPTPMANDISIVAGASTMTTTAFSPDPKSVALGGAASVTIRWVNRDITNNGTYGGGSSATTHEIASDNGAFATSAPLGGDATYSITLSAPGTYTYHCMIHPNMVGTINVTP